MDLRDEAIHQAVSAQDVATARELFREYADWLKVDLCFQDFERDLATLPGDYAPPHGRLLRAFHHEKAVGCVEIPGYYDNRLPGVVFMKLRLAG
jgi:hypothetical protein